jgi:hypothetical protein
MSNNEKYLTRDQAYKAMYRFLEIEYELTQSDEIAILLGSMSILEDGSTADPAMSEAWAQALKDMTKGNDIKLKISTAKRR